MHIQRLLMNYAYAAHWLDRLPAQMGTFFIIHYTKSGHLISVRQKQAPLNHGKPVQISIPLTRTCKLSVTPKEYSNTKCVHIYNTIYQIPTLKPSQQETCRLVLIIQEQIQDAPSIPNDELLLVPVT